MIRSFIHELYDSVRKANELTYLPVVFADDNDGLEYYDSSKAHMLNYDDADKFCEEWGGQLLVLDSSEMELYLSIKFEKSEDRFWYLSNSERSEYNPDNETTRSQEVGNRTCKEIDLNELLNYETNCEKKNPFICRRMVQLPVPDTDNADTILLQGYLKKT